MSHGETVEAKLLFTRALENPDDADALDAFGRRMKPYHLFILFPHLLN
jgi:hypothetical protein